MSHRCGRLRCWPRHWASPSPRLSLKSFGFRRGDHGLESRITTHCIDICSYASGGVMELKTFTIKDIRSWHPCYDPSRYLPEGWSGNALDILRMENIPADDRLWVVLRKEVLDAKTLRLFAVLCARSVEHLFTDARYRNAIDVAERYAHGLATDEEVTMARAAVFPAAAVAAEATVAAEAAVAARVAAWAAAGAAAGATVAAEAAVAAEATVAAW